MPGKKRSLSSASPKGPTQRQLRVAGEIRKILADIFSRGDFPAPFRTPITVSRVNISPDFSVAWVSVMPLTGADPEGSLSFLNDNSWWFRKMMSKYLGLRIVPDLKFFIDGSFDEAFRIEKLLHQPRVQEDIKKDS